MVAELNITTSKKISTGTTDPTGMIARFKRCSMPKNAPRVRGDVCKKVSMLLKASSWLVGEDGRWLPRLSMVMTI